MSVFVSINHGDHNIAVAAHKVQRAEGDVVRFDFSVDNTVPVKSAKAVHLAWTIEQVFGVHCNDALFVADFYERLVANSKRDHDFHELTWQQAVEAAIATTQIVEAGDRLVAHLAKKKGARA